MLPVDHARAAHAAMPGSRLEIFEDTGHLPQLDDAHRFIAVVNDFVATTDPGTHSDERWTNLLRSQGGRNST